MAGILKSVKILNGDKELRWHNIVFQGDEAKGVSFITWSLEFDTGQVTYSHVTQSQPSVQGITRTGSLRPNISFLAWSCNVPILKRYRFKLLSSPFPLLIIITLWTLPCFVKPWPETSTFHTLHMMFFFSRISSYSPVQCTSEHHTSLLLLVPRCMPSGQSVRREYRHSVSVQYALIYFKTLRLFGQTLCDCVTDALEWWAIVHKQAQNG